MIWNELAETLAALVGAVTTPPGTGLVVTEAELSIPLEVRTAKRDGRLVILAQPAHSRWATGFLPPTHMSHLCIAADGDHGR